MLDHALALSKESCKGCLPTKFSVYIGASDQRMDIDASPYPQTHAVLGQATYAASGKPGGDRRIGRMVQEKKIRQKLVGKKNPKKQQVRYDI